MYLTFDSSILISDYYLKGYIFKLILENHDDCGYKLLISDIVLEETSNKFGEELWDFNRINKRNFQIIPEQFLKTISKRDIDILKVNYAQYLENSFERIGNKSVMFDFMDLIQLKLKEYFKRRFQRKSHFEKTKRVLEML